MQVLNQYYDKRSLIRYIVVGILNTIVGYVSFILIYKFTKLILVSVIFSTILGVLNSFIWNSQWTFKSRYSKFAIRILFRFLTLYAFIAFINWLLLEIAKYLHLNVILAQLPSLFVTIVIGYIFQRLWVFK